jgi:hypothetical protein
LRALVAVAAHHVSHEADIGRNGRPPVARDAQQRAGGPYFLCLDAQPDQPAHAGADDGERARAKHVDRLQRIGPDVDLDMIAGIVIVSFIERDGNRPAVFGF